MQGLRFALLTTLFGLAACSETSPAAATTPAAEGPRASRSGADIVNQYCLTCHGRGLYNAPRMGDAEAWQVKLAEGREHLWQVVLQGEKAMPPRGNCQDCTDDELRAAMDYLIAQSVPAGN